jgi:hypothetical protein
MQIDHIARATTRAERELSQRGCPCVIFKNRSDTESILDNPRQRKVFEARHTVRALRDATICVDRPAKGDADSLDDRVVDIATAHTRLDQPANRIDGDGRVGAVANCVGAIDHPPIRVGERDTMPPTAYFDGDG